MVGRLFVNVFHVKHERPTECRRPSDSVVYSSMFHVKHDGETTRIVRRSVVASRQIAYLYPWTYTKPWLDWHIEASK